MIRMWKRTTMIGTGDFAQLHRFGVVADARRAALQGTIISVYV